MSSLDPCDLPISDYSRTYLGNHLRHLRSALQRYSFILSWSVAEARAPRNEFVFVEYGGGAGLLSLLAKEFGLGTVVYSDIYEPSCVDARAIGQAVSAEADHYVQGDIDAVIGFVQSHGLQCDAISSYDVIEHIYDIEDFLRKLPLLSDKELVTVMASGANAHNPRTRKQLMKFHHKTEYLGRESRPGLKETYCTEAYVEVRERIIRDREPSLSEDDVANLVRATRGLVESDIAAVVDEFAQTGTISRQPDHPTNTCNPFDGNWAERLLDTAHLSEVLRKEGFEVDVLPGGHGAEPRMLKRALGACLNRLIGLVGRRGLALAPFYALYGRTRAGSRAHRG